MVSAWHRYRRRTAPAARSRHTRQRGSATVELAVQAPLLMMLILAVIGIGRISAAIQAVQTSAAQAARAASIARTDLDAQTDGKAAAQVTLDDHLLRCTDSAVTVDTSQMSVPVGQPASVAVTVTCVVDLSDVSGMVPLPGHLTVTRTSTSMIDPYRGRSQQ